MYHAIRMHHATLACIMSVGAAGGSGSLIGVSTRLSRDSLTQAIHLLCVRLIVCTCSVVCSGLSAESDFKSGGSREKKRNKIGLKNGLVKW